VEISHGITFPDGRRALRRGATLGGRAFGLEGGSWPLSLRLALGPGLFLAVSMSMSGEGKPGPGLVSAF